MKILRKGTYYGTMRSELGIPSIKISEYDYTLPHTDWHYHENPYFMYVMQGNLFDRNKRKETLCEPGSLIFHNWQEEHWNKNDSVHARGFHIEFEREWYQKRKLQVDLWEGSQKIEDPRVHHILARIYAEFKIQDEYSNVSIELLLLELCENIERGKVNQHQSEPDWLIDLKELVHADEGPLDLHSLSVRIGVHPVHISRAIPRYLSSTLGTYIRHQKVKRSLSYLMDPKFSLTEISYICGFSDQSHFIRSFKACFHMTPGSYRKGIKGTRKFSS